MGGSPSRIVCVCVVCACVCSAARLRRARVHIRAPGEPQRARAVHNRDPLANCYALLPVFLPHRGGVLGDWSAVQGAQKRCVGCSSIKLS